jgi:choline kinase
MVDAVVLMAGYGTRLRPLTGNLPKPLALVNGTPLIEWVLGALENQDDPIQRVLVVTGYRCNVLISHLEAIQENYAFQIVPVINPQFSRGNGSSLCAAERHIETEPFLLLMGDHIVEPAIIEAALGLKDNTDVSLALCTDSAPLVSNEEADLPTKVLLDTDSGIIDIGKQISNWNCIDTGVFLMTRDIFDSLHSLGTEKQTITRGVKHLIHSNKTVIGVDVSGMFWSDVDTPDDLVRTEAFLRDSLSTTFQICHTEEELVLKEEFEYQKQSLQRYYGEIPEPKW